MRSGWDWSDQESISMPSPKLAVAALALGLLAAGCQQAGTAIDRSIGPGATATTLSPADTEFALRAASGSNAEISLGELAQKNAASPAVKEFGQRMIADHRRLNQELTTIVGARGLTPPSTPSEPEVAAAAALSQRTGAAFDRAYLEEQVAAHELTLTLFRHAARNAGDPSLRSFAAREAGTIEEHLEEAQSLLRQVGTQA
jgi:putative membrane protein